MRPKDSPAQPFLRPGRSLTLSQALGESDVLASLGERLRESRARYDCVRGSLPGTLAAHVTPGPVDTEGWTLLAGNGAVASKLRQLQPAIEQAAREAGFPPRMLRIKVIGR